MSLLDRLVGAVAPLLSGSSRLQPRPPYAPYPSREANERYNALFCDVSSAEALPPGEAALRSLAEDEAADGAQRYRAYRTLRQMKCEVPQKILLGVIVELPQASGIEVLAGYVDGAVHHLSGTGHAELLQGLDEVRTLRRLFTAARPAVNLIGPWARDRIRLPPPPAGNVRLSFLVSDGWYFGEGQLSSMEQGEMGGPIIRCAQEFLSELTREAQAG